jgi:hypothetical protein
VFHEEAARFHGRFFSLCGIDCGTCSMTSHVMDRAQPLWESTSIEKATSPSNNQPTTKEKTP